MSEWVAAGDIRNWMAEDPLLDWLSLYGKEKGFVPDDERPNYDKRTDMSAFIFPKGHEFERRVVELLRSRCNLCDVERGSRDHEIAATRELIEGSVEAIYQGVLADPETMTYGRPDLIVRNDVFAKLCDCPPQTGDDRSFRIVDIKFTSLKFLKSGWVAGKEDKKAQLYVYNRALGATQGHVPEVAYLIGRSYGDGDERITSCLHTLAPVDMTDTELASNVDAAVQWVRRVRAEGRDWHVLPEPTIDELRPRVGNDKESPWRGAKKEINEQLCDLTSLWYVSPKKRPRALSKGVSRHDDPNCRADLFGMSPGMTAKLQRIIESQKPGSPPVMPERIQSGRDYWHPKPDLEFYVDFETVNDLDDKFDAFPERGGQPLIFMIGCGHEQDGEWKFECFACDRLNEPDEAKMIDAWIAHMRAISTEFGVSAPTVFHWSPAEERSLTSAFDAARKRHPDNNWPEPKWYDYLTEVVRPEPVTVKGAYAFGLKAVANAMVRNDLIDTNWGSSRIDGMGAMLGGWACDEEAEKLGCSMRDLDLMKEIEEYNEVDCKVMWEAINYLRNHH